MGYTIVECKCVYLFSIFCLGLEEFRRHLANTSGEADKYEFGVCEAVEGHMVTLPWSGSSAPVLPSESASSEAWPEECKGTGLESVLEHGPWLFSLLAV